MASKWTEGIKPRSFRWVITDRFGVCERPGGYGPGHRSVRRLEEIIWLSRNQIDLIVSLTAIPYNLHDYDKQRLAYAHLPFGDVRAGRERLEQILTTIHDQAATGRVVLHHDSLGDPVLGVVAGYLLWAGLVESGPEAITVTEQLLERELGPSARAVVTLARQLPAPS